MYGWYWRHLPGPWPIKALISLALFLAIALVLFTWVFPVLAPLLPFGDTTLQTVLPALIT